ncbi:hypothetical protein TrRE_jg9898 [Triparma retinervis]|uniref:Cation efflux protein transmembrane domain-containing protein n=1 Tax=Triparma retinervis TaxID=2557542 RepID=A0A9W7FBW7_9STRA|nr:hypothetical protein TrRE_jg9898 [Triparma retinervis]
MATEETSLKGVSSLGCTTGSGASSATISPFTSLTLSLAETLTCRPKMGPTQHKDMALNLSLWINVLILVTKIFAFIVSGSLSVLAALVDSALDILSQIILYWAEGKSKNSSVAIYPAGATRFEPVGVIITAAVMGMGSLSLIKESLSNLISNATSGTVPSLGGGGSSWLSLLAVIAVKVLLSLYCRSVTSLLTSTKAGSIATIEAMYQDHFNDALSNFIAVVALVLAMNHPNMWWVDPLGAIVISLYIMYSWYETGTEEIEKIVGRAADQSLLDSITSLGNAHHPSLSVDICRCYHFGPKFLVEMEVILPADMLLRDTHDIGMSLQYKLENVPEVERAFVHIDYSAREYDEHVMSRKVKSYQDQINMTSPQGSEKNLNLIV